MIDDDETERNTKKAKQKTKHNPNNSIKKQAEDPNRYFSKEDVQVANKREKMLSITNNQKNAN